MEGDPVPVRVLYLVGVALYQWILAALILSAGRPDAVRGGVAFVLVANGLESANVIIPGEPFHGMHAIGRALDGAIVATLAFILLQYPTPLGGPRGARVARVLLPVAIAAWTYVSYRPLAPGSGFPNILAHDPFFLVAGAVLALHTLPKTFRLPSGPLRVQSSLMAAGIGLGVLYIDFFEGVGALVTREIIAPFPHAYYTTYRALLLYFALAAVAVAVAGAVRTRSSETLFLAAAVVAPIVLVVGARFLEWNVEYALLSQAFRPLLISAALLRFDLFRVPRALRRPLVPVSIGLFAVTVFVFGHETFRGGLLLAPSPFALGPSLAALAGVATLGYFARSALETALATSRAPEDAADARARLERYRLALERARATPGPDAQREVERLRRSLDVSLAEHDALASVIDGHLVIPATALHGAAPGHVVDGRYEVVREIGRGGQGRVLLARDRSNGSEVALKEIPRPWSEDADARRAALRREADAAARVRSDRVARVFGFAETPLETYLVREFVPGEPLDAVVAARGPLSPAAAASVADDVLAALEAVHQAGLLHLDVKPANVILRPDSRAVLIDQGASRPVADADATRVRDAGRLVSIRYAAPEQLVGTRRLDARTDVHQVGGLLYYLLAGKPPTDGSTEFEIAAAARNSAPLAWPDHVPSALRRVVERARAANPASRPANAAALRQELRAALEAKDGTRAG